MSARTYYDVLDLNCGATEREVREAYERAIGLIDGDNVAGYLMLDEEAQAGARAEIESAYAVLVDPEQRAAYDAQVNGSGSHAIAPRALAAARAETGAENGRSAQSTPGVSLKETKPKMRFLRPIESQPPTAAEVPLLLQDDSIVDSDFIRRMRESRGMTIRELSQKTKVGRTYLEAIEKGEPDGLPARVFLRGFLTQVARVFRVDRAELADRYLAALDDKRPE